MLQVCASLWPKSCRQYVCFIRCYGLSCSTLQHSDFLGICSEYEQETNKAENIQDRVKTGKENVQNSSASQGSRLAHQKAIKAQTYIYSATQFKEFKQNLAAIGSDLDIRGLTTAINRTVYLKDATISQKRVLLDDILSLMAARGLKQLDALALGQIIWAYGKCRHAPEREYLQELTSMILNNTDQFDGQAFNNVLYGFSFMPRCPPNIFADLAPAISERLHEFKPRYIANIAWACALAGFEDQHFLFTISQAATDKLNDFQPQDISNIIWAFSKLNFVDRALFDKVANAALQKADQFEPLGISSTLLSFAHLNRKDDVFFEMMAQVAKDKIRKFQTQSISNVVFAYAKLGYRNEELMATMSKRTLEIIDQMEPQGLSTLAWAHAELEIQNEELFKAINQEALIRLNEFDSSALSQLMFGLAKGGYMDKKLVGHLHKLVMPKLGQYKPNELANLMWAFSKAGMYDSKLFTIGLEAGLKHKFGAKSIANLMDAIATVRHYDNMTCLRFSRSIEKKVDMFTSDSIATILVSLAKLGYTEKFPFEYIAYTYMLPDTLSFTSHESVTNVCFAVACAGIWMPQFWEQISQEFKKLKSTKFTVQQLRQLALVQLASDVEGAQAFQLPHKLSIQCYNALLMNKRTVPENVRTEVIKCLEQFGYDIELDKQIEEGLFADIVIKHKQDGKVYDVALLICGPEFYSQNPVYHPNGEIQLLQRLIMYRGYKAGQISQIRWSEQGTEHDKLAYVRDKVRKTIQYSHHGRSGDRPNQQASDENLGDEED